MVCSERESVIWETETAGSHLDVRGAVDVYVRDGHGIHKDRDRQYIPGCRVEY